MIARSEVAPVQYSGTPYLRPYNLEGGRGPSPSCALLLHSHNSYKGLCAHKCIECTPTGDPEVALHKVEPPGLGVAPEAARHCTTH